MWFYEASFLTISGAIPQKYLPYTYANFYVILTVEKEPIRLPLSHDMYCLSHIFPYKKEKKLFFSGKCEISLDYAAVS